MISIVIPTYNRARVISRAIESALSQTYSETEIIVIDDCSSDNTDEIVSKYCRTDRRVRFFKAPANLGAGGARNLGISEASGDYVAFLDSDDEWLPQKLAEQYRFMRENPEVALCYCSYQRIFMDGSLGDIYPDPIEERKIDSDHQLAAFLKECHVSTQTVMIKSEVLKAIGGFNVAYRSLEDNVLALNVLRNYPVRYFDEILVNVYATPDSVSQNVGGYFQARLKMLDEYFNEMQMTGVLSDVCDEIAGHAIRLRLDDKILPMVKSIVEARGRQQ